MNKFIMVPYDMYRGLMSNKPVDIFDTDNIESIKSKINNIKKNRKLETSAKNILLNQQLRRFLKMRRDIQDKPVKVQFSEPIKTTRGIQVVGTKDAGIQVQRSEIEDNLLEGVPDFLKKAPINVGSPGEEEGPKVMRRPQRRTPAKKGAVAQPNISQFYNTRKHHQALAEKNLVGSGKFRFKPSLWRKN